METRANYLLIGLFTILGFLGILAFFLWFARVELDRQFAYYDVRFTSVSGLSNASDVRFSGLPVGQVVDVRLAPERNGTILVRIEVAAETPVRTDSVATIEAQGVTGVSFVGIDPGTPDAPLLVSDGTNVPEIAAGRSMLQSLSEDAPELLNETLLVVQQIRSLLGGENEGRLERILVNIEEATEGFSRTLEDFSSVTATVNDFAGEIGRFNATLETLTGDLSGVLTSADQTLASIEALTTDARGFVAAGTETLGSVRATVDQTGAFVSGELTQTTAELRETVAALRDQVAAFSTDARALMTTLGTTGTTATARLEESRETLRAIDALLAQLTTTAVSLDGTVGRVDALIESDGAPLLVETRALVADAREVTSLVRTIATADLPVIISDIRAATANSTRMIAEVGQSLTSAGGRVDQLSLSAETALNEATTTFRNANETLAAINAALLTGEQALGAAERAFAGADRVMNEDIAGVVASLETTLDGLNAAVAQVSGDLPAISADLRAASQSASDAFAELQSIAGTASPGIADFARNTLPLFSRLTQETRELIDNLDGLVRQIERDPARFFLDKDTPEFRR